MEGGKLVNGKGALWSGWERNNCRSGNKWMRSEGEGGGMGAEEKIAWRIETRSLGISFFLLIRNQTYIMLFAQLFLRFESNFELFLTMSLISFK